MTRQRAVSSEIRKINRNLIFHYLYDHPAVTKQELCAALGMSMPTITQNLTELLEKDLVSNADMLESTGGRKARALSIRKSARHAIGLDITAHHITAVALDLTGGIVARRRRRQPFTSSEAYFRSMAALIEELVDEAGIGRDTILGAGLAVPAIVSEDGERLTYASILNFTDGRLRDFAEFVPYPCRFINDANAGGFAEYWNNPALRSADDEKGVAYLSLNNSVGGSFLIGGSVYPGQNQRASEFGHITLVPEGRKCYCGQKGCADSYLAAGLLTAQTDGSLELFFDHLRAGRPDAVALWDEYLYYLALTINTLRMVFDCNIIIGGYVGGYMAPYMPRLRERIALRNHFERDGGYLQPCAYKIDATAVGAALMLISDLVKSV